jgi:hypothetical protein
MTVDWLLFVLPIPAIYSLHLSPAKKFGVMLVFLTGGLYVITFDCGRNCPLTTYAYSAAIASTVTLYYRVRLQQDPSDQLWKVSYVYIWA